MVGIKQELNSKFRNSYEPRFNLSQTSHSQVSNELLNKEDNQIINNERVSNDNNLDNLAKNQSIIQSGSHSNQTNNNYDSKNEDRKNSITYNSNKRPDTPKINFMEGIKRKGIKYRTQRKGFLYSDIDKRLVEYAENDDFNSDINIELLCEYLNLPVKDLVNITKITLKVDAEEQSLQRIGEIIPNIVELKLNNSLIKSIRSLGTSFKNLRILWISRVQMSEISGEII